MNADDRFPLRWPDGQARTPYERRRAADFKVDFPRSRDELLHALQLLGAGNVILSTNIALRQDGLPYANMPEPKDPGVAVYFDRRVGQDRKPFTIACDSYAKVRWNTRAVWATVEALRSIQRHGATALLEQAFTGFAALPPKPSDRPWWDVLGVSRDESKDVVRQRYLVLIQQNHPDRGGDSARAAAINDAYRQSGGA